MGQILRVKKRAEGGVILPELRRFAGPENTRVVAEVVAEGRGTASSLAVFALRG